MDMPTLSRMRFSTEQLPFIERYFCVRTNSLSVMATGTRIIPFLHQFARPVLFCVKANCSLSRCAVSARTPLHVPAAGWTYPRVFIVCCWFSIRGLELFNAPDRPYCWCCVIHRLLISCRSPLPLLFLLRFKSSLTSSATCKPSNSSEVMSPDFRLGGKRQDSSWLMKMTRRITRFLASTNRTNRSRTNRLLSALRWPSLEQRAVSCFYRSIIPSRETSRLIFIFPGRRKLRTLLLPSSRWWTGMKTRRG